MPRRKTPHRAPPYEELDPPYDIKLVFFVQKITFFVLRKINKNCCKHRCTFWLQYAPIRLSTGASPQTHCRSLQSSPRPLAVFRRSTSKGRGKERRGGERMGNGPLPQSPGSTPDNRPRLCIQAAYKVDSSSKCRRKNSALQVYLRSVHLSLAPACKAINCSCGILDQQTKMCNKNLHTQKPSGPGPHISVNWLHRSLSRQPAAEYQQ